MRTVSVKLLKERLSLSDCVIKMLPCQCDKVVSLDLLHSQR